MDHQEQMKKEAIAIASSMIDEEINLIEGCRLISSLRHRIGDPDNKIFIPFRSVDSETEHFPLGEMRKMYDIEYLRKVDTEMEEYLIDAKPDIIKACHELIKELSKSLDAKVKS